MSVVGAAERPATAKGGIMAQWLLHRGGASRRGRHGRTRRLVAGAGAILVVATTYLAPHASAARPVTSLSWSPVELAFGPISVGGLDHQQIVLTNTGTKTIRKPDITVTGNDFFIGPETCSASVLRPGGSCSVTVIYAPFAVGPATGEVSTTASKTLFAASLSGSGVSPTVPEVSSSASDEPPHSCAVDPTTGVLCWGDNEFGQLGDGTLDTRSTPVAVVGLVEEITAVAVGEFHTCALTTSGAVTCWGRNDVGQLGIGAGPDSTTPVDVHGLSAGVVAIAASGSLTCAVRADRSVSCWGVNDVVVLDNGHRYPRNLEPAAITLSQ